MNPASGSLIGLARTLSHCEHLLLNFHGPVCDFSLQSATGVTGWLNEFLSDQDVRLPDAIRDSGDPFDILRFVLATCPDLADHAEAGISKHEIRAAALTRPSPGLRTLFHGPAPLSVTGNATPAAIKSYLARLYRPHLTRVRLIIGRIGADPAMLPPSPTPITQAALLLGVQPRACAVIASTPADIESARLAGARSIGYARTPAARERLTAAGADATIASMYQLAGSIYRTSLRDTGRSPTPGTRP
jgi:phosphoglycolate phosphatase